MSNYCQLNWDNCQCLWLSPAQMQGDAVGSLTSFQSAKSDRDCGFCLVLRACIKAVAVMLQVM